MAKQQESGKETGTGANDELAQALAEHGEFPQNIAFRQAADKVASYPEPIHSGQQAKEEIFGIGDKLASTIDAKLAEMGGGGGQSGQKEREDQKGSGRGRGRGGQGQGDEAPRAPHSAGSRSHGGGRGGNRDAE